MKVIVGEMAGGESCAAYLRRMDEKAEIIMVEGGPYVSHENCRVEAAQVSAAQAVLGTEGP